MGNGLEKQVWTSDGIFKILVDQSYYVETLEDVISH